MRSGDSSARLGAREPTMLTKAEVVKVAEKARDEAKGPRWLPNPQWRPSEYLVIGANHKGVILADRTVMPWVQAAKVAGKLRVEKARKDGLLEVMRRVYVQVRGCRPQIATVGKAIAAL